MRSARSHRPLAISTARWRAAGVAALGLAAAGATLAGVGLLLSPAVLLFVVLLLGLTPGERLLERLRLRRYPRRPARAPRVLASSRVVVVRRRTSPAASALAMRPPPPAAAVMS